MFFWGSKLNHCKFLICNMECSPSQRGQKMVSKILFNTHMQVAGEYWTNRGSFLHLMFGAKTYLKWRSIFLCDREEHRKRGRECLQVIPWVSNLEFQYFWHSEKRKQRIKSQNLPSLCVSRLKGHWRWILFMVAWKLQLEIPVLWTPSCKFSTMLGATGVREQGREVGKEADTGEQVWGSLTKIWLLASRGACFTFICSYFHFLQLSVFHLKLWNFWSKCTFSKPKY